MSDNKSVLLCLLWAKYAHNAQITKKLDEAEKVLAKLKWLYRINKEHLQTTKNCFKLAVVAASQLGMTALSEIWFGHGKGSRI